MNIFCLNLIVCTLGCPYNQTLYNDICVNDNCTVPYLNRLRWYLNFNGYATLDRYGVVIEFKDSETDGITWEDNHASCIHRVLHNYKRNKVVTNPNFQSTFDSNTNFRKWEFFIDRTQFDSELEVKITNNIEIWSGYYGIKFNIQDIPQLELLFAFQIGIDRNTQKANYGNFQKQIKYNFINYSPYEIINKINSNLTILAVEKLEAINIYKLQILFQVTDSQFDQYPLIEPRVVINQQYTIASKIISQRWGRLILQIDEIQLVNVLMITVTCKLELNQYPNQIIVGIFNEKVIVDYKQIIASAQLKLGDFSILFDKTNTVLIVLVQIFHSPINVDCNLQNWQLFSHNANYYNQYVKQHQVQCQEYYTIIEFHIRPSEFNNLLVRDLQNYHMLRYYGYYSLRLMQWKSIKLYYQIIIGFQMPFTNNIQQEEINIQSVDKFTTCSTSTFGQHCVVSVENTLQFYSEPSCTQVIPYPTQLEYGKNIWLKQTITDPLFQDFTPANTVVNVRYNGKLKEIQFRQLQKNKNYVIIEWTVKEFYLQFTVTIDSIVMGYDNSDKYIKYAAHAKSESQTINCVISDNVQCLRTKSLIRDTSTDMIIRGLVVWLLFAWHAIIY